MGLVYIDMHARPSRDRPPSPEVSELEQIIAQNTESLKQQMVERHRGQDKSSKGAQLGWRFCQKLCRCRVGFSFSFSGSRLWPLPWL